MLCPLGLPLLKPSVAAMSALCLQVAATQRSSCLLAYLLKPPLLCYCCHFTDVRVFAFDKDPKRLKRLQANVLHTGAQDIITAERADFLSLDPTAPQFIKVGSRRGL